MSLSKSYALFVRNSYGDLLMTDPLIRYIKSLNDKNKITLFVDENNFQLVEFMENIDEYFILPSKGNKYLIFSIYGLKHRKKNYDISIAAKTGIGSANGFFQFMLGAKKQISYVSQNKTWTDQLINNPIVFSESIYHNQHYALGVLQLLDRGITEIPISLFPKLLCKKNITDNLKLNLIISVSNNRDECKLTNKNMAYVLNSLYKKYDFDVYISSLKTDIDAAKDLKKRLAPNSIIKLTPNLKEFIELINIMDICFFGEGGSMHIAAALGVPQVVLFGKTSPITWSPLSKFSALISNSINVNNIDLDEIIQTLENKFKKINLAP